MKAVFETEHLSTDLATVNKRLSSFINSFLIQDITLSEDNFDKFEAMLDAKGSDERGTLIRNVKSLHLCGDGYTLRDEEYFARFKTVISPTVLSKLDLSLIWAYPHDLTELLEPVNLENVCHLKIRLISVESLTITGHLLKRCSGSLTHLTLDTLSRIYKNPGLNCLPEISSPQISGLFR